MRSGRDPEALQVARDLNLIAPLWNEVHGRPAAGISGESDAGAQGRDPIYPAVHVASQQKVHEHAGGHTSSSPGRKTVTANVYENQ